MLTNKQAIEHIDSIMSNYDCPLAKDRDNPNYRLCNVWISETDIEAFEMAKDALKNINN